jgi:hypothetical protein
MNDDQRNIVLGDDDQGGFDSRDTEIFVLDGPGDTTVRPCRPSLLKVLLAEREKLIRYGQMPPSPPTPPPDTPEPGKSDK